MRFKLSTAEVSYYEAVSFGYKVWKSQQRERVFFCLFSALSIWYLFGPVIKLIPVS